MVEMIRFIMDLLKIVMMNIELHHVEMFIAPSQPGAK
jgi:hypothetical protein